jgi:hypothetical protein
VVCDPEGEWSVRGEVVLIDGQAACRRITVYRNEMPGVTSTLLRQVPLGRVLTDCRAAFAIYERDLESLLRRLAKQAATVTASHGIWKNPVSLNGSGCGLSLGTKNSSV